MLHVRCPTSRDVTDRTALIPLASGGEHSYANVQSAHFLCNAVKSHGPAQLRIAAAF